MKADTKNFTVITETFLLLESDPERMIDPVNNQKQTLIWVIAIIAVCACLVIGMVWSYYFSVSSGNPSDQTTSASASTTETSTAIADDPDTPKKRIALTFDDGPSSVYTHKILDLLEQYNAKATFFVLGDMLKSNTKDEIARAVALGCEIGNHSFDHLSLTSASKEEILEQIRSTNEKIKEYSGTDYECHIYRPPYGNINRNVMETLYDDGLRMYSILWSSDSRDWEYRSNYAKGEITRDEAIESAFRTVVNETSDGTVVLMHDIQEITPDILALILEKYTSEGYEFVTVSELFGFDEMTDEDAYFNRYRSVSSILPVS